MGREGRSNIDLYYMPPLDVKTVDDHGLEVLRAAIVLQACKEYVDMYRAIKKARGKAAYQQRLASLNELKTFFHSGWYDTLVGGRADGDKVMHTLETNPPRKWLAKDEKEALYEQEKPLHNGGPKKRRVSAGASTSDIPGGQHAGRVADHGDRAVEQGRERGEARGPYDDRGCVRQLGQAAGAQAPDAGPDEGRQGPGDRDGHGGGVKGGGFCDTVLRNAGRAGH